MAPVFAAVAAAVEPEGSDAFVSAIIQSPVLRAAAARIEGAHARVAATGQLPDPQLELMASRASEPMASYGMWELQLRQPLPKAGERAASRDRATSLRDMAEADYAVMAGEMAMDLAMALAEAEAAREREAILTTQIERMQAFAGALEARVSTGAGRTTDRLALTNRIEGMRLMREREAQMAAGALAEARARLSLSGDAPLPAFRVPPRSRLSAATAPQALLAGSRVAEARAMARMARANAHPMTAVGLIASRENMPEARKDSIGVSFMTDLPWRSRRTAVAEQRAARAEERAARSDQEAVAAQLDAALSRVERAERFLQVANDSAAGAQARLNAEYDTLVRAAGAAPMGSDSAVLMVMELVDREAALRIQKVDARLALQTALAGLWRFAPAEFFNPAQP
ncbi:TolC family protein [Nibricoccus sp. IMCC34717]|uniref:TolC family protein n=1 Tax=Nibricoccus sp. IMCC34717 TaxID=3034021 RepID=UPI0038513311